ncbi:MAG: IclR family transcriptional regulator [Mycobacterium sp.]
MTSIEPHYRVEGVDNTLKLLTLLRRSEHLRVSDAAKHLEVARSTAHRLLRMLVYRGFAVQSEDRTYMAGPELGIPAGRLVGHSLQRSLRPAMRQISEILNETVTLLVLEHDKALFVACVEARQAHHVRPPIGKSMPAERNSGGRVLLSQLPVRAVRELYADRPDVDMARLETVLERTRRRGFALNINEGHPGVSAVGVCVVRAGQPVGAVTVSAPTLRFRPARGAEYAELLRDALARTELA